MPVKWIRNTRAERQTRITRVPRTPVPKSRPDVPALIAAAPPKPRNARLESSPLLSILIPTTPGREPKLALVCAALDLQLENRTDVELLVLRDSRGMTIGEKRGRMLQIARGKYVAFVDDDDLVASDYVEAITSRLAADDPDCLCFQVLVEGHGPKRICRYHPELINRNLGHEYHRKPNHLMVWRRTLAVREQFPSIQSGEDTVWANRMSKHAQKVSTIDRVLYTYKFDRNDNSSEA